MNTLRDLIFRRTNLREKFLEILLDFTHNETLSVRNNAIRIAKNLHERDEFKQSIEVTKTSTIRIRLFSLLFHSETRVEISQTFDRCSTA